MIRVSALVAHDKMRIIGVGNDIPWRMRDDLKRFKERTVGQFCVVGRKTFDAMPVLTDRNFIVVSELLYNAGPNPYDEQYSVLARDIEMAIEMAKTGADTLDQTEIFVIGGGEIYQAAMPYLDRIYATEINTATLRGNWEEVKFFPPMAYELWTERRELQESIAKNDRNEHNATIRVYDRIW